MEFKLKEKYLVLWFPEGVVVHGTTPRSYVDILKIAKIYYKSYVEAAQRLCEDSDYIKLQIKRGEMTEEGVSRMFWEHFKYTVPETTECVFLNLKQAIDFIMMDVDTNVIFFYMSNNKLRMNIVNILYAWTLDEIPREKGTKILPSTNLDFMDMGLREIDEAISIFDKYKGSKFVYIDRKSRDKMLDILRGCNILREQIMIYCI